MTISSIFRASVALIAIVLGSACGDGGTTGPATGDASLELTPTAPDTLFSLGDTLRLTAVVRHGSGTTTNANVTYRSSASSVATVSSAGVVVSVGNGTAIITANSASASDSVAVRVRQKLARVVVSNPTSRLAVGATTVLLVSTADSRGAAMTGLAAPTFSSSDNGIATVSGTGVVTAVSTGSAVITARVTSLLDGTSSGTREIAVVTVGQSATVGMGTTTFLPPAVDVGRAGTVTFVNGSGVLHDVDFGEPSRNIPIHASGQNARTFANPGIFDFHCNLHAGMTGTVFVH